MGIEADKTQTGVLDVVVVDEHTVFVEGLSSLISADARFSLVGAHESALHALADVDRLLRARRRVVILVDLRLGGDQDAFWLIRSLRERRPAVSVVATGGDGISMECISKALFVGADGFVSKLCSSAELFDAMIATSNGELVLEGTPPSWIGAIAQNVEQHSHETPLLSDREVQVLLLAREGLTGRDMGENLGLAERTIGSHLGRIYHKLGVNSRVAAIRAADELGLFASSPSLAPVPARSAG